MPAALTPSPIGSRVSVLLLTTKSAICNQALTNKQLGARRSELAAELARCDEQLRERTQSSWERAAATLADGRLDVVIPTRGASMPMQVPKCPPESSSVFGDFLAERPKTCSARICGGARWAEALANLRARKSTDGVSDAAESS